MYEMPEYVKEDATGSLHTIAKITIIHVRLTTAAFFSL